MPGEAYEMPQRPASRAAGRRYAFPTRRCNARTGTTRANPLEPGRRGAAYGRPRQLPPTAAYGCQAACASYAAYGRLRQL